MIGPNAFSFLFIIPSALCLLYVYLYLPETKGRETNEIVTILRSTNRRDSVVCILDRGHM